MDKNRIRDFGNDDSVRRSFIEKWESEPDYVDVLLLGAYHLIVSRHPSLGHLNGYVGIRRTHPYYRLGMGDKRIQGIDVHGGITFASKAVGNGFKKGFWYLGFDTAHAWDFVPMLQEQLMQMPKELKSMMGKIEEMMNAFSNNSLSAINRKENYKGIDFVSEEVQKLYRELVQAYARRPDYKPNYAREYKRAHREKV